MKWLFVALGMCITVVAHTDLTPYLKKLPETTKNKSPIKNIDFIYLINLDQRPEKLQKCLSQLHPFGIFPNRFPAIFGCGLPPEVLHGAGVKFLPGMMGEEWVAYFSPEGNGKPEIEFLREESYGKSFLCRWMTPGMVGCALSHISVLQDAYDSGYETIWVMEDDISIQKDPHLLSQFIKKLDSVVGKDKWDILYTDTDKYDKDIYQEGNDFESDLKGDLWFYIRPDLDLSDHSIYAKRTIVNEDFIKIGSRLRAHSLIIRRSGIKKILDFMKEHHIFLQYDHELAIVPGIQMFNLRSEIVTYEPSIISDTTTYDLADSEAAWKKHKTAILEQVPKLLGWREPEKVEKIIEFLRETKPQICVEIGSFGGAMTYPIATTLRFLGQGCLFAIDAWDVPTALDGLVIDKDIEWWKKVNMEAMHEQFTKLLSEKQLECQVIHKRSQEAVSSFADESIDFLFIDGSTSTKGSLDDATLYLPKVKKGGFIWLNRTNLESKNKAIAFLMKNCKWIKEKSVGMDCVLFQKTKGKEQL